MSDQQDKRRPGTPAHVWVHMAEDWLIVAPFAWLVVQVPRHVLPTAYLCLVVFCGGLIFAASVVAECSKRVKAGSLALGVYVAVATVALTGWLAWARLGGEHLVTLTVLAGMVAVGVPAGAQLWARWLEDRAQVAQDAEDRARRAELEGWDKMLAEFGIHDVKAVEVGSNRAGITVTWKLAGKTTYEALCEIGQPVAARRQLSRDKVTFEEGDHAGIVVMHLNLKDVLSEVVLFTEPPEPLSVTRPLEVGTRQDGERLAILFRQIMIMLIGVTRSGKTNVLHVIIALLVMCTDCTVWVIDFKGGRLAAPWIRPWASDPAVVKHPAIDWVATTRPQAYRLLRCAQAWGQSRMDAREGGSKVHPSPVTPQLWIVVDESARATGTGTPRADQGGGVSNAQLAALIDDLGISGAGEAIGVLIATQRGTGDFTGSTMFKSQALMRIMMRAATAQDAGYTIDDPQAARMLARLKHAGSGIIWVPGEKTPLASRFDRLDPDEDETPEDLAKILRIARRAGPIRPGPEPAAVAAMDALTFDDTDPVTGKPVKVRNAWTNRWDDCDLYQRLRPARPDPGVPGTRQQHGGTAVITDAEAVLLAQMEAGFEDDAEPEGPDPGLTPRQAMYGYLAQVPGIGAAPADILGHLNGLGLIKDTDTGWANMRRYVHRWLAEDVRSGKVTRDERTGRYRAASTGGQAA